MGDILIPKPIAAFRSWRVDGLGRLIPLHRSGEQSPWMPRAIAQAVCDRRDDVPHRNCACGLYGWLEPGGVNHTPPRTVEGVFLAFGRVVVHGRGLRAGKGRIVALLDDSDKAREVASLYELALVPDEEALKKEAERWGELRKPTEEAGLGLGVFLSRRAAPVTNPWSGSVHSGFRTPQEQAEMAGAASPGTSYHGGGYVGGRNRRLIVSLVLGENAVIEHVQHPGGGMRTRVKNLPDYWTIRTVEEQIDRIEVSMMGSSRAAVKPGRRTIILEIEADFLSGPEARRALDGLRGVGHITQLTESPIV